MSHRRAKHIRKTLRAAAVPHMPAVVTTHSRDFHQVGAAVVPLHHRVVNPIRYPEGSFRREYQDAKHNA